MSDYIYDIESFPNVFTLCAVSVDTGECFVFALHSRRNDIESLVAFIWRLRAERSRMIGFNNVAFDYPVIHYIVDNYLKGITPFEINNKVNQIINASHEVAFAMMIWDDDRYVEQVDLYKIHHFDNMARSTSLKMLEFNMRSDNIADLPFPPGTFLDYDQIQELILYNWNDVHETHKFYNESIHMIRFREELSIKHGMNFVNHNDGKIGKEFCINELERLMPGICYDKSSGRRVPRQTPRPVINLADAIFSYISFRTHEFTRVKDWLSVQRITETKGVFKDLSATVNGFEYVFGLGGIHGSIGPTTVRSDDEYVLLDIDVTSYYPSLGIANRIYPKHLSEQFCDIYENIKKQRLTYDKSRPENAMLKLALNSVYGDSNNAFSPFYDPMYTMKITINGQLLLCMLAEYIAQVPGLRMIQINTDGMTVKLPRKQVDSFRQIYHTWESLTGLDLEEVEYSRMFIRDVNNYIAENVNGELKRKGAYAYDRSSQKEMPWHKNHSSFVVQKAAEANLVSGKDIREFITCHDDIMDFMLRTKVPRSSKLTLEFDVEETIQLQNITRYYISTRGGSLVKTMPPLAKNPTKQRRFRINAGWVVTPCNNMRDASRDDLNYEWYIEEAHKLVDKLKF